MVVGACRQGACWCLGGDRRRLVGGPLRPILAGGWQVKKGPQAVVGGPVRMPGLERRNSVSRAFLRPQPNIRNIIGRCVGICEMAANGPWACGIGLGLTPAAASVRQRSQDVAQAGSAERRCAGVGARAGLPCGVGQHGHVAPVAKRQGSVVRPPHGQKMSVVAGPRGAKKNAPPAGVPAARRVHQRRTRDLPISIGPASSDARRRSP